MDTLIYDPDRLACSAEEKEACLETVKKLAHLGPLVRREGYLVVLALAETETDPFFRACLLESGDICDTAGLKKLFTAYLAAGNYHGGPFLNAVLIAKGLLLLSEQIADNSDQYLKPGAWGRLLSAELRGFFGAEYRERVMAVIAQETKIPNKRETSFIPEFDRFVQIDLPQRQALLQDTLLRDQEIWTLAIALRGASAAAEAALLEALTEDDRKRLEENFPFTENIRVTDVTQAQEGLLEQWGLVKPGEVLKSLIPETDDVIVNT